MIDWNEQAYLDHYNIKIRWPDSGDPANVNGERTGEQLTYGKDFARYAGRGPSSYWFFVRRAAALVNKLETLGLLPSHRIMIVGCGYGYMVYCFRHASAHPNIASDYPNTWGIDLSSYIATNWDAQRLGDEEYVNDDWVDNNKQRVINKLESMTGGFSTFHVVINFVTESYNPVTEATELDNMFVACERGLVGTDYRRVIHIVDNALRPGEDGSEPYYQTHQNYGATLMTLENWAALRPAHSWIDARTNRVIVGV